MNAFTNLDRRNYESQTQADHFSVIYFLLHAFDQTSRATVLVQTFLY